MSGEHLILLPGMLLDGGLFAHQAEHLSDVVDVQIGDITTAGDVGGLAQSVLDDAPERFALAGLSLGGIVAFEILRRAPGRVERLTLLDTSARPPRPEQLELWREFEDMTGAGRLTEVNEKHILPSLFHPDRRHDEELAGEVRRMASGADGEGFMRQLSAQRSRPDSRGRLGEIRCPTLVVGGRQDALCPVELQEEISRAIPGSRLVVIEDCGHLSSLERPQAVTALLRYWLQDG